MGAGPGTATHDHLPSLAMLGDPAPGRWKGYMACSESSVTTETGFSPTLHYDRTRGLQITDNVFDAEFEDAYVCPRTKTSQTVGAGDNFLAYSNNADATAT